MLKKEELFVLIQSLSRSEKRYFKVFCSQTQAGKNYQRLFDLIARQENYDEDAIKKAFRGETFVRQLHVTKNYLRHLIMKSLRNFHSELSRDAEVKDILRNVEILFHKELYQHCKVELRRADRLAGIYELDTAMIEIQHWKRRLSQALAPQNYAPIREIIREQETTIEKITNVRQYWALAVGANHTKGGERQFEQLLETPENARTLQARVLHYNLAYQRKLMSGTDPHAHRLLYELLDYMEERRELLLEYPGFYASTINNLIGHRLFQKDYAEAIMLVKKAKEAYSQWKLVSENRTLLKQVLRTYNIELEIYRDNPGLEGRESLIGDVKEFLEHHIHKIPKEYVYSFWFQLASISFFEENFSRALYWINQILNRREKGIREDIQLQARFLNLMTHFEMKNFFVMRYFVDNTRRYIRKLRPLTREENLLLRFFSKISRSPESEFKGLFRRLKEKIAAENRADMRDYIHYQQWLEKKVEPTPKY